MSDLSTKDEDLEFEFESTKSCQDILSAIKTYERQIVKLGSQLNPAVQPVSQIPMFNYILTQSLI